MEENKPINILLKEGASAVCELSANIELTQLDDKYQKYLDKYIAYVSKDKDQLSRDELYFLEKDIEKETMYIECFLEWLQKKGVGLNDINCDNCNCKSKH